MSLFSKYRPRGYTFSEPERYTPSVARERRLQNALLKNEQLQRRAENSVSGAKKKYADPYTPVSVKAQQTLGPKAASIAAALGKFKERDFVDPDKRKAYRDLRRLQEEVRQADRQLTKHKKSGGGQQNAKPSGADRRQYHPERKDYTGSTIFGTAARLSDRVAAAAGVMPAFFRATAVVPCIQRAMKKEVMFAKGYAGKGYHTRKRRTSSSGIPC